MTLALQKLRAQRLLCDVVLVTKEEQHFAHQVILAAASKSFKEHIFAQNRQQASPAPELSLPPLALEIELENLPSDFILSTMLDEIYGQGPNSEEQHLCKSDSSFLLQLQQLQEKGHLCDLLLSVGTDHFAAHQVILAAAGGDPFRSLILDGKKQLGLTDAASETQNLELELRGVKSAEAVKILLDFLYARSTWKDRHVNAETCKDVMHLASEFKLPALKEQGLLWNQLLTLPPPLPLPAEEKADGHANGPAAADAEHDAEEPENEGEANDEDEVVESELPEEKNEENPEVFLKMRCIKFDAKTIPMPPATSAQEAAEAAGEIYNRQDTSFLATLVRVFWEWPIWLEPVLQQSPAWSMRKMDPDRFKRLIPFVAYQWKDGPWQQAYTRLGFDPREAPEEALTCQVILFKDEAFRGRGWQPRPSEDISFLKAPTSRNQLYQLECLKEDEYIRDLLTGFDPKSLGDFCDRRSGFLGEVLLEVIQERLKVKAAELHSKKRKATVSRPTGARKVRRG